MGNKLNEVQHDQINHYNGHPQHKRVEIDPKIITKLMQIGITGSSGFLGSNLTKALRQLSDAKVTTLQRNPSGNFPTINGLSSFVNELDLIYHVAGVNRGTNKEILRGNVEATFNLIESIKISGNSPRIVFTSSSQVYKPLVQSKKIISELHKTEPATLFGIAKKTAEDLIRLSGIEYIILRISNIYGPGCSPEYNSVIATFCHRAANGDPITIDGDGHQKRDFIYIEDVIQALVLAGTKEDKLVSGVYNVGTGQTTSLRQVIRSIRAAGAEVKPTFAEKAVIGQNSFALDASRFRKRFGWKPKVLSNKGIKNTLLWLQKKGTL